MEEKLQKLYNECINDLKSIGINILNNKMVGEVSIELAKRNCKRYGCCKQEMPCKDSKYIVKRGRKKYIKYGRYEKHSIEISKWVMDLNEDIIKDTIVHELIHCLPGCDNHGKDFMFYANKINKELGYNIKRVGDKKADYKESNIEYKQEQNEYKYEIICEDCKQRIYRKRLKKNFIKKYRCGKCGGKLKIITKND